jgi:hypothetical protein
MMTLRKATDLTTGLRSAEVSPSQRQNLTIEFIVSGKLNVAKHRSNSKLLKLRKRYRQALYFGRERGGRVDLERIAIKLTRAAAIAFGSMAHLSGCFRKFPVNSLFGRKIPCSGGKNSLFPCVGNFAVVCWNCWRNPTILAPKRVKSVKFPVKFPVTGNLQGICRQQRNGACRADSVRPETALGAAGGVDKVLRYSRLKPVCRAAAKRAGKPQRTG